MSNAQKKHPYVLLRAIVAMWLLSWGVIIVLFIKNQFSSQPLLSWPIGMAWLGLSVLGWIIGFRFLKRLRAQDKQ